jgi:pimeloyl-ACP methyl ester carboxylesterase
MKHLILTGMILLQTVVASMASAAIAPSLCQALFAGAQENGFEAGSFSLSTGERLAVRQRGSSAADTVVIFLNGIDQELTQWNEIAQSLSGSRPDALYVQLDLFGQGQTAKMNKRTNQAIPFAKQIAALNELIERNGWHRKNLVLVGHSYGGGIAARYAAEYPGRVSNAVLIAPFVDDLEVYQPGVGPAMWALRMAAEMTGFRELYDANVMMGSRAAMAASWQMHSFTTGTHADLGDVMALTEGVRNIGMTQTMQALGKTQVSLGIAVFDEMIPVTGHMNLWASIPSANRRTSKNFLSGHDAVKARPAAVAELVATTLPQPVRRTSRH